MKTIFKILSVALVASVTAPMNVHADDRDVARDIQRTMQRIYDQDYYDDLFHAYEWLHKTTTAAQSEIEETGRNAFGGHLCTGGSLLAAIKRETREIDDLIDDPVMGRYRAIDEAATEELSQSSWDVGVLEDFCKHRYSSHLLRTPNANDAAKAIDHLNLIANNGMERVDEASRLDARQELAEIKQKQNEKKGNKGPVPLPNRGVEKLEFKRYGITPR